MKTHTNILYSLLKDRDHSIGCEVGVHAGDTTEFLLKNLPHIERYYAVDPWKIYKMYDGKNYKKPGHKKYKTLEEAMKNFYRLTKPYEEKVICYRMTSVDAAKHIKKSSLDWVYIDANHEYEYIKENLRLWTIKVKPGGLVAGHDYANKHKWHDGIKRAVDEFVPKDKLKIHPCYVWSFIRGDF